MACSVSTSFSPPLCASKTLFKEIHAIRLILRRLSSQATSISVTKPFAPCSRSRCISSAKQSYPDHLVAVSRNFGEVVSCYLDVSSCTRTVTGYWVGPDIDDGWGIVEAFLYRIT